MCDACIKKQPKQTVCPECRDIFLEEGELICWQCTAQQEIMTEMKNKHNKQNNIDKEYDEMMRAKHKEIMEEVIEEDQEVIEEDN